MINKKIFQLAKTILQGTEVQFYCENPIKNLNLIVKEDVLYFHYPENKEDNDEIRLINSKEGNFIMIYDLICEIMEEVEFKDFSIKLF